MNAEIINKYGETLYSSGDLLCAGNAFKKAIEINPKLAIAHSNLAVFYYYTGNLQDAFNHIELAQKQEPTNQSVNENFKFIIGQYQLLRQLPVEEQRLAIQKKIKDSDTAIKKYNTMQWTQERFRIVQLRWMLYNTWVKNSPLYNSSQIQQQFSAKTEEENFKYIECPLCGDKHFNIFYHTTSSAGYSIVQCSKCDFLYRNPTYGTKRLKQVYNQGYLNFLSGSYQSGRKEMYKKKLDQIGLDKITQNFTRRRLLDIGCGHGLFLTCARELGWEPYGLDFAEDCIKYARENFDLGNVAVGNLEDNSFEPEFFDVVTLWSVAAHLEAPLKMFSKISRILRPGGILIVYTVDASGLMHQVQMSGWEGFQGNHLIFFSPESLTRALNMSGFASVDIKHDNRFLDSVDRTNSRTAEDIAFFESISKEINLGWMITACAIKQ